MTLAHLALSAVLLAARPARPAPAEALKGCEVRGPGFGLDRVVRCKTFTVDVFPAAPAAKEAAALGEFARALAAVSDTKEMLMVSDVKVAGKPRKSIRYMKRRREDGQREIGLITTVPAGADGFRLVRCWQGMEMGCLEVAALLARGLPEPSAAAKAEAPQLAGRPLAAEAGCTFRPPGQLACAGGELTWQELFPRAPDTLDLVEEVLHNALWVRGELKARDRYCQIEGTDALCREVTVTPRGGPSSSILYGFTSARGVRLYVACSARDLSASIPAPCAQVMGLKAPEK